jgi:hypothetical protein
MNLEVPKTNRKNKQFGTRNFMQDPIPCAHIEQWKNSFIGLAYQGKDIVFGFIIE